MDHDDAMASLRNKFTSGNEVQVERTTILREEWEAIRDLIRYYSLTCLENDAIFDACWRVIGGAEVDEFELSYPLVATVMELMEGNNGTNR
jgi:hypothetical protein